MELNRPGFVGGSNSRETGAMTNHHKTSPRYSPEVRERAVRLVFDHAGEHSSQWAAIQSIASKVGCTAETLRRWVRQTETDQGKRSGVSSSDRERLKELERENREQFGVEPICKVLPIAPSTYYSHKHLERSPDQRSDRAKRDERLEPEITRV